MTPGARPSPREALAAKIAAIRNPYTRQAREAKGQAYYAIEDGAFEDCRSLVLAALPPDGEREAAGLREALEEALPDALSDLTEGSDHAEAPDPSDEPGSPYVRLLAANLAVHPALRAALAGQEAERRPKTIRSFDGKPSTPTHPLPAEVPFSVAVGAPEPPLDRTSHIGYCGHSWETGSMVCPECGADWTEYYRSRHPALFSDKPE